MLKIHEAAIETLETIGFANSLPSCIELITSAGGSLTSDGRLLVPREMVEDALSKGSEEHYTSRPRSGIRFGSKWLSNLLWDGGRGSSCG